MITTVLAPILLRKLFEKEPPEEAPTKAEAEDTTAPGCMPTYLL